MKYHEKKRKGKYKFIKVSEWVCQNLKQAMLSLSRKGIDSFPSEILSPECCPNCNSKMEKLELKYSYKKCPYCGYKQQDFSAFLDFLKGIGIGAGIDLSAPLLLYFLSKTDTYLNNSTEEIQSK